LRQVEQALLSHPQVSQALVTGWPPAAASSTQLAAYLVAGGDGTPAPEALRQHLAARLPTYMLPTSYSMLDALPRLPNGKLDRLNLPAPDLPAAREDYRAPATPAESRLAAIFSAVLQIDRVGAHDNFFNLGGHSLLATQLVGLVQQEFGVALAIATLFQHPTVAALADDLHRLSNGAGAAGPDAAAGAPITPVPRSERLLPSFAQERMWFLHHFVKGAPYNTPALALLNGEIDHAVLEAALRGVIARHEALRTNFTERDDTLYQVVGSAERFTLPLEQVADHAQLDLAIAAASTQPFDLEHELLLRARLFRVSAHVHYLFVTIHHIVFDGWSTAILLRELGLHYACISGATAASALPPPLALQYPDYAQWERRHFDPARLAPGLAYWQSRLDGAQALILPTDAARPPLQDFSGALIGIDIPADLLDRLQGLSARHGATLYMTLLAAFSVLLGRHAGQDDFCIGSPIANRDQPQVRELIGLFVNTLALRVRPQPALSFEELLQQVRQSALEAYAHQEVPFEKIVEALELPRDTARSPLVQVMFNFQHGAAGLELPGLAVAPLMLHNGAAKFEITLDLTLSNGALSGFFEYASALFSEASMRRLSSQFLALLEAAVSAPRSAVGALPLAGPPERSAAPDASTPQPPPAVAGVTLTHQLFEQYAASHPGRIAVAEPTGVLSYAALNARANRIGAWLRAQGVQRGTLVGLCARHSSALLAAVLGIAKAGAALVLIDPNAGPDAAYALLYESGLAIVLTETGLRAGLPTDDQLVACLDDASDPFAACADDNLAPWPEAAEQLAYVDYSPDADGQLRGAMVSHQALLGAVLAWRARHALGERHRFLLQAPLAGRLVIGELFLWFACGASVQVAADGADAPAADVLFLTPDQLAALISAERALATPAAFPQLLLCGPDPVPRGLAAKLAALAPHCTLAPLYAFAGVVLGLCAAAPEGGAAHGYTLPLGEAAHGARFQVRDGYRRPCAIGIAGELYLGGTGLAHGYLNDRAASAADFVTDPDGSSWYRSGQCARLLSDGTLEWLGQFPPAPTQRVELARIEAALLELPIVSHAIATLRSDGSVVAHLIPDQAGFDAHFAATPASASTSASASDPAPDPDPAELGARAAQPQVEAFVHLALARHLPDYMQPAALVWMAQFPLQDDGRTARSNLPAAPAAASAERPYLAPRSALEQSLGAVMQTVLKVSRVGLHDSFFDLGGHSVLAIQLVYGVRKALGIDIPVTLVFEAPLLETLAARIAQLQREGAGAAAPITRAERGEALPLAYQQERLWFVHEHMPEQRTSYNIVVAAHFHGTDFSAAAMAAAYQDLLARHEVLRTRFVFDAAANAARQVIAPTLQLDIAQRDIAAETLPALIGAAAADCVDLARGPLLKVALLRLSDEHHVVLSTIHHIVSDGWSQGVIAHDLRQLYAARRGAPAAALAPLAVQYADYAAWQRRQDMSAHLAYWSGALAGYVDGIELPYDAARGAGRTWRAAVVEHHYSPQLAGALASFSQARQCTLFVTLLCALVVVLQRYSGRDDLCIGTTVAGRERAELEHLVGFFINILPLRLDLAGAPDLAGLLEHVRQVVLRGFDHQALPFEHLLNALRGQRDSSQIPLVPVLLRHQNFPAETERAWAGGLLAGKIEVGGERTTPSELDWQFHGDANALSVTLEYAADLFSRDTIERMIAHHQQVLEAMLADAGQPVRGLVLLTGHEQRLYADLNATARAHPPAPGLAARFARQAAAHPHALACVGLADGAAPPMTLTYGVLAARAGQLARRLQTLGAGPDTRVAVVCERAPELLVALLAILHTGACYVPVDPHYPQHYIAQILDDARPDLLLCQRALATRLPANHPATAWLDLDDAGRLGDPGLADLEPAAAAAPERPDQLACLMYTSGSTGRPKGVMVPYGQIGNWLEAAWERAPFLRDEMMLHKTSICFAVSVKELLSALLAGAPQLMLPDSHVKDSAALAAAIAHWRVTRLHLVPSHLQALLDSVADDSTALASLQQVVCAGEALPAALRARLRQRLPQVALWNNYGCTELNDVSYYRPDGPAAGPSVPIGYPISNTSVYVLDAQLREV
ncbi:AMP-binding protein, partial [Rugamonas sp. CCM 8940]|uniref:condensation domain-containing protein n=1 Tax=Rugamonas sp. CCM 8940 TaxID=2765359 RepID=UPI0018F34520